MVAEQDNIIGFGTGIYTTSEVAQILRLPRAKVKRWLNDYWNAEFSSRSIKYSEGQGAERVTNFHTLIEFFTFYQLREKKISVPKIIKAHKILSEHFNTQYPFATYGILTDGEKVLFEDEVGEIINADESLQTYITQVIRPFCERIEFDADYLATRFFPNGKKSQVIIDPKRKFGQPIIKGTNILTQTIYALYQAQESIAKIAIVFDLTEEQVRDAINFHDRVAA
jgi:uncharacterized protein (DUF433 family)